MAWKPKQKQLSKEEAIAMAKRDLAPFWLGSPPLLAAIPRGDVVEALPLDSSFSTKKWLLVFCSPYEYSGETAIHFALEWYARYSEQDMGFIVVLSDDTGLQLSARAGETALKKSDGKICFVTDRDRLLSTAFGTRDSTKIAFFDRGRTVFEFEDKLPTLEWFQKIEAQIQKYLRTVDPGAPFFSLYAPESAFASQIDRIDFGGGQTRSQSGLKFEGKWTPGEKYISTQDPGAALTLDIPARRLALVAKGYSKEALPSKITFEVDENPAYESFFDSEMTFDENGLAAIFVSDPALYHALAALDRGDHQIKLRFPNANLAPVALYRILLGV